MKKYKVRVTTKPNAYYQTGGQQMFTQEGLQAEAAGIGSAYNNPSVYDYLAAHGQAQNADYNSRKAIAQNLGIKNYKGTAEQNLQMLEMLKKTQDLASLTQAPVQQEGPVVTPIRNTKSTPNTLPKAQAPQTPQESTWQQYLPLGITAAGLTGAGIFGHFYNNANADAATTVANNVKQAGAKVKVDPFKRAEQIAESIRSRGRYTAAEMAELQKLHAEADLGKMIENVKAGFKRVTPTSVANRSAANQAYEQAYQEAKGLWPAISDAYSAAKATPLFQFLRRRQDGGQNEDSMLENIAEVFDPTGITAWDDAYRAYNDPNMPGWEKGLVMASALPLVGKVGKGAKAAVNLSKFAKAKNIAGKIITPIAQSDKYINPASQFVQHMTGAAMSHAPEFLQKYLPGVVNTGNQVRRFDTAYDLLTKQYGGDYDLDAMAYGGQYGHSLDLGSRVIDNEMGQTDPNEVRDTLQAVPRDMANLEAERGETAYGDLDDDGEMEHSKIGGKRHSEGGTPLNLKPGTFIYSDTKSMKLKGQALAQFGKSVSTKKGYTPAQLAKQYELNKYKAILADPNADQYQKRTAEMMMNNNKFKLAQLALAQEAKKGFPQGIPQAAMMALPPEMAEQLQGMQEPQGMEQSPEAMEYQKRGGSTFSGNAWYQQGGIHLDPAKKGTFKAQATRMGMSTQEAAAHILANKDEYSPEMVKKANFARNFAKEDGGLIEFQKRGEVRYPVYPKQERTMLGKLDPNQFAIRIPSTAQALNATLPAMQPSVSGAPGVYGEQNYWDPNHQAEFARNQSWYMDNAPGWNPSIPGATMAFQTAYDQKRGELNMPSYFTGAIKHQAKDDKFGKYTYSAPSLTPYLGMKSKQIQPLPVNIPAPTIKKGDDYEYWRDQYERSQVTPEEKAPNAPTPGTPNKEYRPDRTRMMLPDKAAILQSLFTRAGIPTLSPFVQAPDYVLPETVFADPTRQYAAVAEQANMQNQGLRSFGRPQSYLAGSSQIAGKQLEAIANIDAATNAQNVGIANQANAVNAATINQNLAQRAQAANQLAEMSNKYNLENFSMKDAADKQTLAAYQNAFANRSRLDAINKTDQYFTIDPNTGMAVQKQGSVDLTSNKGTDATADPFKQYMSLKQQALAAGMTEEEAKDYIKQMMGNTNKTTTSYNQAGVLNKSSKVQSNMLAALASLYGGAGAYPFSQQD